MKTLGLPGGMTWPMTVVYYEEINKHVRCRFGGTNAAHLLLHSFNMAEMMPLLGSRSATSCSMQPRGSKVAGDDLIVICANLPHKSADVVETKGGLPVLHIADCTAANVVKTGYKRVGLLATKSVMEDDFYVQRLRDKFNLQVSVPEEQFRDFLNKVIFEELAVGVVSAEVKDRLIKQCRQFIAEGVECIILGRRELRLVLFKDDVDVPLFETTTLHAKGAAGWASEGVGQAD